MAETDVPNYTYVITKPIWSNGSETSATQQRRVVADKDVIKAADINNLREIIDITFNHTHSYTDAVGGGGGGC